MRKLSLIFLIILSSCVSQEKVDQEKYEEAVRVAETSGKDEMNFGFGFKSGMNKKEVVDQLKDLSKKMKILLKLLHIVR